MPSPAFSAIELKRGIAVHETTDIVITRKMKGSGDIDVTIQKSSGTPALRAHSSTLTSYVNLLYCVMLACPGTTKNRVREHQLRGAR